MQVNTSGRAGVVVVGGRQEPYRWHPGARWWDAGRAANIPLMRIAVYVVVWLVAGCRSLKDVRVIIPMAVEQGESAALQCFYDLEGDQLYAAKWYRRGREFYRYTPRDDPPSKFFPLDGVNVQLENSNSTHVVLTNVSVNTTGEYRCEISADAPSFFTKIEGAYLEVVEVPRYDPVISGLKSRYRLEDILKAECTSKDSRPAANLTWLANGLPVDPAKIRRHHPHLSDHNTYSAHSGLRLKLSRAHFASGRLKIRCVASLYNIYYRSSEKSVELERPKRKETNNNNNNGQHHYSGISNTLYTMGVTSMPPYGVPATANYWEHDSLPAERAPQTTLIFSMANDYPSSAVKVSSILYLAFLPIYLL